MNQSTTTPNVTCKGLTFLPVPEFTDLDLAFGAKEDRYFNRRDLPEVPREYEKEVDRLFFKGGKFPEFGEDVDVNKARRAVRAWLSSFSPSHESKTATVAYAFWVWSKESAEARKRA